MVSWYSARVLPTKNRLERGKESCPLTAEQVLGAFEELKNRFFPLGTPLEDCIFRDAYLRLQLVLGVPESEEHMEHRGLIRDRRIGDWWLLSDREHLDDPDWEDKLFEEP